MNTIKEYWFLITFGITAMGGVSVWIATIDSKSFDNPEQKVKVVKHVEESMSPAQKQRAYIMDSLNKDNAIKTRKKRLKMELHRDSIRGVQDSIILDIVKRNADQIYQIKEYLKLDSIR